MLKELIDVAGGRKPADYLLKNCQLIDVINGEIVPTAIAVYKDKIAGIGEHPAKEIIDLNGQYVCPAFIDSHIHIESSLLNPVEFANEAAVHGTGAVIADPHEIANVLGIAGIKYMLEVTENLPIDFYFTLPSCVPSCKLENSGANLEAKQLAPLLKKERIVGLAEMMNYPGVIRGNQEIIKKIEMIRSKVIDGHAPGLKGKDLQAYIAAGILNDHESTTLEEAREKLKLGMYIKIREGSSEKNLEILMPMVNIKNNHFFSFCSDDLMAEDLKKGHINLLVKKAVKMGMDPVVAVRIAALNPALHYNLKKIGALVPGYFANFIIFEDLHEFKIRCVYRRGKQIVHKKELLHPHSLKKKSVVKKTFNVKPFKTEVFKIKALSTRARVIEVIPGQVITGSRLDVVKIKDGYVEANPDKDILKIAVVERHKGLGHISVGLVSGFGLKRGAIAQSVAHDSHNIICVGVQPEDMASAVRQVSKLKGGIVAVLGGFVLAQLPLAIAGLMSESKIDEVLTQLERLEHVAAELGSKIEEPFSTLSFLALPVIPKLKITDRGLVDVDSFKLVKLFE
ncbi:adenine deaminase [Candidatus Margulisiibacteriota bacterium]